jgi:vitamin B12 transporter
MKNWLSLVALVLALHPGFTQTTISGRVTDNKKHALIGVSISLKDGYDGATTDSSGLFSFKTTEKGRQIIVASIIGYRPVEQAIEIGAANINVDLQMKEEVSELKAVVITAGTFEASDKKKTTVLSPLDIVTTASGNGDITGALKTLPGAQQVGEHEGLFVRGGTATETKIFIDGTLVNNFFYSSVPNVAQRGRFSPFLFSGTVFSTGGYSALYGQALSSALILESIDLPERSQATLGISVIGVNGAYQKLSKNKKSSWGISYGYTNPALAIKLYKSVQKYSNYPVFHTGDANFRIRTSQTGFLKYYGYFSGNQLAFRTPSIDTLGYKDAFALKNFNMYHNLSYRENIGWKIKLNAGLSYSNNKNDISSRLNDQDNKEVVLQGLEFKNFGLIQKGDYLNAKMVFERRMRGLTMIRFGGEYNYSNDRSDFTNYNGQAFNSRVRENLATAFAESDIYITNDVAAKLGTRFEHSALLNKVNFAPRVSLAYKLSRQDQASLAYGIFYQDPETQYLPGINPLGFSKATHYILQYQKVTNLVTLRLEAFYKKYEKLLKTDFTYFGQQMVAANNNGYGDARGFEVFWRDKKTVRNLDYWVSYSFLDTKRDFLNFPYAIQPSFAARHTASVVLKKFVTKWKTGFNASYNFASGRPYYYIGYDDNTHAYKFDDIGKTPDYNNVSFSINYIPGIGKQNAKMFAVYVLSVSNIFGINQVYNFQYSYDGSRKEAVIPSVKTFVYIGVFISFGVDRTQDAINNNL